MSGKFYVYRKLSSEADNMYVAVDNIGFSVENGSSKTGTKEIQIPSADFDKEFTYYIVFIEGSSNTPPSWTSSPLSTTTTITTTVNPNITQIKAIGAENDIHVSFIAPTQLNSSTDASYKYTLQYSKSTGGATYGDWTDWKTNQTFDGRTDAYTHNYSASSSCDNYKFRIVVSAFNKTYTYTIDDPKNISNMTLFDRNVPLKASKGEFANYVRLHWKVAKQHADSDERFRVFRRVANTSGEWVELEIVSSNLVNVYWNDVNTLTGVFYDYKVVLYQVCNGVETPSDDQTDIGFTQSFGTVSGRITYGTGSSVQGVNMLVNRNELGSNENQYHSLLSTGSASNTFEWADSNKFATIYNADAWTFQFWLNPYSFKYEENGFDLDSITIGNFGDIALFLDMEEHGGYRLRTSISDEQSAIIPADHFTHVVIAKSSNTIRVMTINDQNPESIQIDTVAFAYTHGSLSSANTNLSLGRHLYGNIDDIRLWKKTLTAEELLNSYDRIISGNEKGLAAYWTLDEGLDGYAFDRSRVGTVYNNNHATLQNLQVSQVVPDAKTQLALKAVTDFDGIYQISGIPYTGEGTSYSIVPSLGVHTFNPSKQLRYISPTSMVHNATDFTDVSSFKVKGKVVFSGGNYPVEGCTFEIDEKIVTLANGLPVKTDENGEFTISVPIGMHSVRVVKAGHEFANDGYLYQDSQAKTHINYNQNISGIVFENTTRVKLIGRVVGGLTENDKTLGFGESVNNIGVKEVTLIPAQTKYDLQEVPYSETFKHNEGQWKKPDGRTDDETTVTYNPKSITISVSPETGEYVAWVYPIVYAIGEITAKNYASNIYDKNEQLDLRTTPVSQIDMMPTSVRTWTDSTFISKPGEIPYFKKEEYSDTVRYHAAWKTYYQANPSFSVRQVVNNQEVAYFGDKTYILTDNIIGTTDTILLYDEGIYTFEKPVFTQGTQYEFAVKANETYINYEATEAGEVYEYPIDKGSVMFSNTLAITPSLAIELDNKGKATYTFTAGVPDLTTGINSFFGILYIGDRGYNWDLGTSAIEAWHLGDKSTGTDFMTAGPNEISVILRDPPGSQSYSYIERGSTVTTATSNTITHGMNETLELTTSLGPKLTTFIGLGAGVITETETKFDVSAGIQAEERWINNEEKSQTTTFTERFETSDDPLYVGGRGDVFIGNSTNIQYGLTNGIAIQKHYLGGDELITESSSTYSIAPSVSLAYGQTFDTRFAFAQVQLEEVMIPKWQDNLALLLLPKGTQVNTATIDRPMYVSNLPHDDENFGKLNTDKSAFASQAVSSVSCNDGPSYTIVFPDNYNKALFTLDSVMWYNNQIQGWIDVLAQNEKEKIEMQKLGNYSFAAGSSIEWSKTESSSKTKTSTFNFMINPSIGLVTGGEVMGIGLELEVSVEYVHEEENSKSTTTETSITSGFVLKEEGDDDQITVDYGMTESGTVAFKSRGGRTSCPYEDAEYAKYYEPERKHVLAEATMQIEKPKISVNGGVNHLINIPANKTAKFVLDLKNESETGENVWFELIVDEVTNPYGAELKIDGGIIGNGRLFMVRAGEVLQKTLTIAKGTADKYENIGLILRSQCQSDPTTFLPVIADTVLLSVDFIPACSDVSIKLPKENWIVNTETDDNVLIELEGFERNFPNFGYIAIESRRKGSPTWQSLVHVFADSAVYELSTAISKSVLQHDEKSILYTWGMQHVDDGAFELRARAECISNGNPAESLSSYTTPSVAGDKDMKRPQALGLPLPANGVLAIGDELSITYNEDIVPGMLTTNNFSISGVFNAAAISEPNVGLAFNADGYAFVEQPMYNNGEFSIEAWFTRKANTAGTLFYYGTQDNFISLGFNADGKVVVSTAQQTITSTNAIANDDTWKYISLAVNTVKGTVDVYEYEGASDNAFFIDRELSALPNEQGKLYVGNNVQLSNGYSGNLSQLHFYGYARQQEHIAADKNLQKSGKEKDLLGYWSLDEGHGVLATDKARSRHLTLHTGWYVYPSGNAMLLDGNSYRKIPVSTYALDNYSNTTVEFWFKAAPQANTILLSADYFAIGVDAQSALVLYNADGTIAQTLAHTNLTDNQWHHFAMSVKRLGSTKVYIDGNNTASFASDMLMPLTSGYYYFGAKHTEPQTYSNYLTGAIDEIRIWNSALSQDIIVLNQYNKLQGNEAGLLAYYPFEAYTKESSGILNILPTATNMVDDFEATGSAELSAIGVAIKDVRPEENVPFTFVASERKIVVTLDEDYFSRVEGTMLTIRAKDVYDVHNNRSNTESWTALVNRNPLTWNSSELTATIEHGQAQTLATSITNTGNSAISYSISQLPQWLSVHTTTGTIKAQSSVNLNFSIAKDINIGVYEAAIELSSGNGIIEILPIRIKVTGNRPDWVVRPHDFESSMTITGQVKLMDIFTENSEDLLGAFMNDVCVGLSSPAFVPETNSYFTFLTVYGNSSGTDTLVFKYWEAQTGKIHQIAHVLLHDVEKTMLFVINDIIGDYKTPAIFSSNGNVEQSIALQSGWNWVSYNVANTSPTLLAQSIEKIGKTSTIIKSQNNGFVQSPLWLGNLDSIRNNQMYLIYSSTIQNLQVYGAALKPALAPISIAPAGWTWIGYTPQEAMPLADALAAVNPEIGDQIKSHTAFKTYMGSEGWIGNLEYMNPGEGYMYFSKSNNEKSFAYPSYSVNVYQLKDESLITNKWQADAHKYSQNMTITGQVEINGTIVENESLEIAAFVNGECRGTALLQPKVGSQYAYLYFMTIYGEDVEQVTFRAYDHSTQVEYEISHDEIMYEINKIVGSSVEPFAFKISDYVDNVEYITHNVYVYPNPTADKLYVNHVFENVEIIDAQGKIVLRVANHNRDYIDLAHLPNGTYIIRMYSNEGILQESFIKR